jgi:hypothetical protein
MQVRAPAWEPATTIESEQPGPCGVGAVRDRHDTQQVGLARADTATHAGTHG